MKVFIAAITFLFVTLFMIAFYGVVAFVLGELWGVDMTLMLSVRCGITAYILSIVLPMVLTPAISKE